MKVVMPRDLQRKRGIVQACKELLPIYRKAQHEVLPDSVETS